jgi:hypothetical protein
VTATDVQDSNSLGLVIQVNDGDSVDSGNTVNWNFKPNLALMAPGETFVEGVGKSGTAITQTAGSPFLVTVRAISDQFRTLGGSAITVGVTTSDAFDSEPANAALSSGQQTFSVSLRVAEPAPLASGIQAVSSEVFSGSSTVVNVNPSAYDRLQILLDGEQSTPGSTSGKLGLPAVQVVDQEFKATVRAADQFWNLITAAGDSVGITTVTVTSSVTLPGASVMTSGVAVFSGIAPRTTASFQLKGFNISNIAISSDTSPSISVFPLSRSSPTVTIGIPQGAIVPTLGGALVGTAADVVSVSEVRLAIEDSAAGLFFDWTLLTFSSAIPDFKRTSLNPLNSPETDWSLSFPSSRLTSGKDYFVVVQASNPSQLLTTFESTFSFNTGGLVFNPNDGQGTAAVVPSVGAGCQPLISTVTLTVGASGVGKGGAIALRIPEGWTRPIGAASGTPELGEVRIITASPAFPGSTELLFNPPRIDDVELGDNWVALRVATNAANTFAASSTVDFVFKAFPPLGDAGLGDHLYDVRVRGSGEGQLVSISTVPKLNLIASTAEAIEFDTYDPLVLGPLQASPTMHVRLTDACGNPATSAGAVTIGLSAGDPSSGTFKADQSAQFFAPGGGRGYCFCFYYGRAE